MPRFFADPADISGDRILLREDAHHITHVLRAKAGDELTVCDGEGSDYRCRILTVGEEISCEVLEKCPSAVEPALRITLMQGLPKAEKMEWIIQKNTELGVFRFIPVETKRSIVKLDGKKKNAKEDRWQRVALSAAKQSGRGLIPEVSSPVGLKELASTFSLYDAVLVLYEDEHSNSLKSVLAALGRPRNVALLIGPEGGWEPSEIDFLREHGAKCCGLGPRILRTETAGMTAAAAVLYHFDEME